MTGIRQDMPSASTYADILRGLPAAQPVLIAGPTASGKSALALEIAENQGGVVVNADASQVYECWRVITARPSLEEEARAQHALYGHVAADADYSTGHWLREVGAVLEAGARPIITGGTGLYFTALTKGLAEIPATPPQIRADADELAMDVMLAALDETTLARIDQANRARVQRAWEVQRATGRGLAKWQDETAPPMLPLSDCAAFAFDVEKDLLNARIEKRFDLMLAEGALDEVRAQQPCYDPNLPAHRAIGVQELMAHLEGELTLKAARAAVTLATRQYAKRQRTWIRSKMGDWQNIPIV